MKKFLLLVLAILCLLPARVSAQSSLQKNDIPPAETPVSEPVPVIAADITDKAKLSFSDGSRAEIVTDGKRSTKLKLEAGTKITVSCDEKIYGVYFMFDQPVEPYEIVCPSKTVRCGENGFIHEYIALDGADGFSFTIPSGGAILCSLYLFSRGEAPDWVQLWEKPCERADILLLPTHADDEILFFGGTIPYYGAELGYSVQVAYLTNHWEEYYRPHELLNALWTMGMRNYPVMGNFPDVFARTLNYAKSIYDEEEIISYQVELIRRFRPYVVIGHDLGGEYGHGVHRLNAECLTKSLEVSGDAALYTDSAEKYGAWDVPKTYLHLYAENSIVMNWDIPLSAFGGKTAYELACEGLACHVSQSGVYSMKKTGVYSCLDFGLYRTLVGADTKADFLENIVFEKEENPTVSSSGEATAQQPAKESASEKNTGEGLRPETDISRLILCAALFTAFAAAFICFLLLKRGKQ